MRGRNGSLKDKGSGALPGLKATVSGVVVAGGGVTRECYEKENVGGVVQAARSPRYSLFQ